MIPAKSGKGDVPFWVPGEIVYASNTPATPPQVPQVEPVPPEATSTTPEALQALVARYAAEFHVRPGAMLDTLKCEAQQNPDGTYDPRAQSNFQYHGARENSWGLAQIHLTAHTEVSKAQAQDPDFAVRYMAEQFAAGNARMWTCWKLQH